MIWPFENDTTGIEKKLAVKSLSANRKRNFFVGIIILRSEEHTSELQSP